jgi:hypothetical protein
MQHEMKRSLDQLQLSDMPKPYYMEYLISDVYITYIKASFGAIIESETDQQRLLQTDVRVGNYQFDNTGFLSQDNMFSLYGDYPASIVIEDCYEAIRQELWLNTDAAYKQAIELLSQKKAFLKNRPKTEMAPDNSELPGSANIIPFSAAFISISQWENTIKKISAVFRNYSEIIDSNVEFKAFTVNNYYLNSEGILYQKPQSIAMVRIIAISQTKDHEPIKLFVPYYLPDATKPPAENQLISMAISLANDLICLRNAPRSDDYTGPVVFSAQAAAEIFFQAFLPHLNGDAAPLTENQQDNGVLFKSKLSYKLNRQVLPSFLSIEDNPLKQEYKKEKLLGSYEFDDEGVTAIPLTLIENGILKNLLLSRRPHPTIKTLNGRARGRIFGRAIPYVSNVFIKNHQEKPYTQLLEEMLQLCKAQGLEYGIVIKTIDIPSISGGDDAASSSHYGSSGFSNSLANPLGIFRIYVKDSREEMIRGLSFDDINIRYFKDIIAAGNDYCLYHRQLPPGTGMLNHLLTMTYFRKNIFAIGIPCSIIVPSLLFEELELGKTEIQQKKPPLLPHPFFPSSK